MDVLYLQLAMAFNHHLRFYRICNKTLFMRFIRIDILRVQYRQFRRDLIRQIVQQNLHGTALENLIHTHIQQHISAEHREKCLQDLRFDLEHLAVWNIVGMGISGKELEAWLRK